MRFLHYTVRSGPDTIIQVNIDHRANIRLMDELNFHKYKLKKNYSFAGGLYDPPRAELRPSRQGEWHIVVDLEGLDGDVRAFVDLLRM